MGLRDDIQSDIQDAFDGALYDAVDNFKYYKNEVRNYVDGEVIELSGDYVLFSGVLMYAVMTRADKEPELLDSVTFKLITLRNSLTVDEIITDDVIMSDIHGELRVVASSSDPAKATWTIYLRVVK